MKPPKNHTMKTLKKPANSPSKKRQQARRFIYRWRAEVEPDCMAFLQLLPEGELITYQSFRPTAFPDTYCELEVKSLSLEEVRAIMAKVEDGHVMAGTVQPKDQFTGSRFDHDCCDGMGEYAAAVFAAMNPPIHKIERSAQQAEATPAAARAKARRVKPATARKRS